jgi:hypothetical protein
MGIYCREVPLGSALSSGNGSGIFSSGLPERVFVIRYCYVDGNGNQSPTLRLSTG